MSDKQQSKDAKSPVATQGATPVVQSEELDPGRERRPLESYFQEIGGTRTLKQNFPARDETVFEQEARKHGNECQDPGRNPELSIFGSD